MRGRAPIGAAPTGAALACVLLAAACAPRATGGPGRSSQAPLRVVSYNIHAGTDVARVPSVPRIGALLDSLHADLVLLQEVDRGTARSGGVDQLAELERMTGLHGAFAASLESFQGGQYGIAILSRLPIRSARTIPLRVDSPPERADGSHEPRVALHAVLAGPAGEVHVLATHLDASGTEVYRRQELVGLMAVAAREVPAGAPLLLGGDLNSSAASDEAAALRLALRDAWGACNEATAGAARTEQGGGAEAGATAERGTAARPPEPGATFPATAPVKRIDYVFYRGATCRAAQVPASTASDHRPLVVDLDLGRGTR